MTDSNRSFMTSFRTAWREHTGLCLWLTVLLLLTLVAIFGPFVLPVPTDQDLLEKLQPPSADHWLGTDEFGRDVLSRVVSGGRVSLALGAIVTVTSVVLGSLVGLVAGYYARPSGILMRVMDSLQAFPAIILAIALAVALSNKVVDGVGTTIALTVVYTPMVARVVRSRVLVLANTGYVAAARTSGVPGWKILAVHIAPNAFPTIVVQTTFVYASALLSDAALSFLGLGVAPPTPTWGNMIADAKSVFDLAPWFMIAPGMAIVIAVAALSFAGDGLRAVIDPRAMAVLNVQALRRQMRRSGA